MKKYKLFLIIISLSFLIFNCTKINKEYPKAERGVLDLLSLMKELEIVNFGEFSNTENEQFKKEFSRTIHKITNRII